MTHLRAALSLLACRALEAHYRRNLARVVPQPEPQPSRRAPGNWPGAAEVRLVRVRMRADLAESTGLADQDFAKWQAERERDVRNTQ